MTTKQQTYGGLLSKKDVLADIESIGYEFESDFFVPLFKGKFDDKMNFYYGKIGGPLYTLDEFREVVHENMGTFFDCDVNDTFYYVHTGAKQKKLIDGSIPGNSIEWSYDHGGEVTDLVYNFREQDGSPTNDWISTKLYIEEPKNKQGNPNPKLVFMAPEDNENNGGLKQANPSLNELALLPVNLPDLELHATYKDLSVFSNRNNIIETTFKPLKN